MATDAAEVRRTIDQAHDLVERGHAHAGVQTFAAARRLAMEVDPARLERVIDVQISALENERRTYRTLLLGQRTADRHLVVLADSLGLPRPDAKDGPLDGAGITYPALLLDRLQGHQVDSNCRRYYTSEDVVSVLEAEPELGTEADVVIHVGLNDCAARMFLEPERLAVGLLDQDIQDRIVGFARRYRRDILLHLPAAHYVDPGRFTANLETACELLRRRRARRVVLATIIVPPIRFWAATPGIQRNFTDYNKRIMDVAHHNDVVLFDVDRHIWAASDGDVLLPDGMHLSAGGHRLFADEVAALLSA